MGSKQVCFGNSVCVCVREREREREKESGCVIVLRCEQTHTCTYTCRSEKEEGLLYIRQRESIFLNAQLTANFRLKIKTL